jgi:DNA-binding CsgD family transcriptional regulator
MESTQGSADDFGKYDVQVPTVRPPMDEAYGGAPRAMPALQTDQVGQARSGYIYFIETEDRQFVKIGYSANPYRRQQTLGTLRPGNFALRLLGCIPGTVQTEQWLHSKFSADRDNGEWFRASPSLIQFIDSLGLGGLLWPDQSKGSGKRRRSATNGLSGSTFCLRDREVLQLVFRGNTATSIAKSMEMTPAHVNTLINALCRKCKVSRSELIVWVLQHPGCMLKGSAYSPGLHAQPCECGSPYCLMARDVSQRVQA